MITNEELESKLEALIKEYKQDTKNRLDITLNDDMKKLKKFFKSFKISNRTTYRFSDESSALLPETLFGLAKIIVEAELPEKSHRHEGLPHSTEVFAKLAEFLDKTDTLTYKDMAHLRIIKKYLTESTFDIYYKGRLHISAQDCSNLISGKKTPTEFDIALQKKILDNVKLDIQLGSKNVGGIKLREEEKENLESESKSVEKPAVPKKPPLVYLHELNALMFALKSETGSAAKSAVLSPAKENAQASAASAAAAAPQPAFKK